MAVLATNLATLLGSDQVVQYPWPGMLSPSVKIDIDVHRFDGRLGDTVVLEASWLLRMAGRKQALQLRRVVIEESFSGRDYDALVAAKSKALAAFSRMIVTELKATE